MTLEELKLLLTLNGNKRIVHIEDQIFVDDELSLYYINAICINDALFEKRYEISKDPLTQDEVMWAIIRYTHQILSSSYIPVHWKHCILYAERHQSETHASRVCEQFKEYFDEHNATK